MIMMFRVSEKPRQRLSLLARVVTAASRFINRRGIFLGRRATRPHVAVYRLSRGRLGGHIPGLPQARILLLDHTGARTGILRTSPVMYCEAEGSIAIAASQAGAPTNPAWFHNLKAHPETTMQIGPEKRAVRARVATNEERERWWPRLVAVYPDYEWMQRLAKDRTIPVVLLEAR